MHLQIALTVLFFYVYFVKESLILLDAAKPRKYWLFQKQHPEAKCSINAKTSSYLSSTLQLRPVLPRLTLEFFLTISAPVLVNPPLRSPSLNTITASTDLHDCRWPRCTFPLEQFYASNFGV